jgi:RNA polymerase sigma factor (sigma-70 family)
MTGLRTDIVLRHIRDFAASENISRLPDRELLDRFATLREEAAFEVLVRRHGPLVLGVCRRVLHNPHDAEDAFQATFLTLARRADSAGRRASLGTWLYQVAYHAALKARKRSASRPEREETTLRPSQPDPLAEVTGRELLAILDEELHRLPERLRMPLVLCYLEGKTREEAARELGCSLGTMKRHLELARAALRSRLTARGLALPAALLTAALVPETGSAVPALLAAATVRLALGGTTVGLANSAVPPAVAALSQAILPRAGAAKIKTALFLIFVVGVAVLGSAFGLEKSATPAAPPAAAPSAKDQPPAEKPAPAPPRPQPPDDKKDMTITGRVLGPDGKPVAEAQLAVVAYRGLFLNYVEGVPGFRNGTLGRARSDADGKFRLSVPHLSPPSAGRVRLLAAAEGLGLAWQRLDPKAESVEVEMRLPREQIVRGRIVDLQGEPVAGARVQVWELTHKPAPGEKNPGPMRVPLEGLPIGPVAATVNAKGDFTLRGLGANVSVDLEVQDDRVELHSFTIDTTDKKQAENVKLALPPGRIVEGRITYQDTGRPAAGARVMIITAGNGEVYGDTDKDGRYRLNVQPPNPQHPEPGNDLGVHAYPPAGEPYWLALQGVAWKKGAARHEMNLALPRGVLLRGKITEAGSDRPVAGAAIEYKSEWLYKGVSAADGSYTYAVPAAATGPLVVTAPTNDYIPQVIGSAEILDGLKGGDRVYYHAIVPLDLKAGDKEKELPVVLRRGVTLKGRLVGPDGKPVEDTLLFVGEYQPPHEKFLYPIHVRDSKFELPGCDPDRTYRLVFVEHPWLTPVFGAEALHTYGQLWLSDLLGAHNKLGATVEVSAKKAATEPVEVRLAPCGSAKVRFVDGDGKPLPKHKPWLQLVVTDGPPSNQAIKEGKLSAEVVTLISQYADDNEPHADADGVLKLEGLIPGATYRLKQARLEGEVLKEFTAEAGKTLELTVMVK